MSKSVKGDEIENEELGLTQGYVYVCAQPPHFVEVCKCKNVDN